MQFLNLRIDIRLPRAPPPFLKRGSSISQLLGWMLGGGDSFVIHDCNVTFDKMRAFVSSVP